MARNAQVVAGGVDETPPTALAAKEWRTLDEIAGFVGVSRREAEAMVEGWRLAGKPIVAGPRGVKWTTDADELDRYVEARRRRIYTMFRGNKALRLTVRRMREKVDLTLWREVA